MATPTSRVIQVLELVLQHPNTVLDAASLCQLLCSSKAVRAAAQQAGGPCAFIGLRANGMADWQVASIVASFARWLPPHANLAGQILLDLEPAGEAGDGLDDRAAHHVLGTLLEFSMQQIAAGDHSNNTASPGSKQQQQQQRPRFGLRSFDSSIKHGVEMLSALPAATLTSLSCNLRGCYRAAGPLAALTNLRQLQLNYPIRGCALASLAALTQLTSLEIRAVLASLPELQQLPASLQRAELHSIHVVDDVDEADDKNDTEASPARKTHQLNLSHLTCLTQLSLQLHGLGNGQLEVRGQPPPQLLELTAGAEERAVLPLLGGVTVLQQLQRLTLCGCCEEEEDLLALNGLTALSDIELRYHEYDFEEEICRAWAQLSALCSLQVTSMPWGDEDDNGGIAGEVSYWSVMRGVAAATSLRRLLLDFLVGVGAEGMRPKLFGYLTGLRQLQELVVGAVHDPRPDSMETDAADIMQLTALTNLTQLAVTYWHVGDVAAVALASYLRQLRTLRLYDCCLESRAALSAIGNLQHLQHLDLRSNEFECSDCLHLLTHLSALTFLGISGVNGDAPTEQQLQEFFAAVHGQQDEAQPQ